MNNSIFNYCCPLKVFDRYKLGLDSSHGIQPFKLPLSLQNKIPATMNKGTHFNGQPMYGNYSAVGARRIVKPQIRLELH